MKTAISDILFILKLYKFRDNKNTRDKTNVLSRGFVYQ